MVLRSKILSVLNRNLIVLKCQNMNVISKIIYTARYSKTWPSSLLYIQQRPIQNPSKRLSKKVTSLEVQSWTKVWRQIHKCKKNRFFCGIFQSLFFAIFYQNASKFDFCVDSWVLIIKPKSFRNFLEIS